jgi:hypothetical protein
MRISSLLIAVCLLLASGATIKGQTAVEYGTIAAGTTGAATDAKKRSNSIGGVFNRIGKNLDQLSRGQQGRQRATAASTKKTANSSKGRRRAVWSAAKPEASRIVNPSEVRIGMSREELLSAVGKPSMQIGGTDEGVFAETYTYPGSAGTVTVTLHEGKVTEVSPRPKESAAAPAPTAPLQTNSAAERPQ